MLIVDESHKSRYDRGSFRNIFIDSPSFVEELYPLHDIAAT